MRKIYQISPPSSKIHNKPDNFSKLETEAIFGEKFEQIKDCNNWKYGKLLADNYTGWIKKEHLTPLENTTHRVCVPRTFIYSQPDIKSSVITYLSLGSKLKLKLFNKKWYKIFFFEKKLKFVGFIFSKHVIEKKKIIKDWVKIAESLTNVPYKWGGKDTIGIDCSSLLQLSLIFFNKKMPRNSFEQEHSIHFKEIEMDEIIRGDVLFWNGHVAICISKTHLIHANATDMNTQVEIITDAVKRIEIDTSSKTRAKRLI